MFSIDVYLVAAEQRIALVLFVFFIAFFFFLRQTMHRNRDDRLNELEDAGTVTVSSRYGGSSFTDIWDSTNIEVRIAV